MSPAPVGPFLPTNALVAVAWAGQRVPGLTASMVATRLPRGFTTWADAGFVQMTPITGAPNVDIPVRRPVMQVDCWAVTVDAQGAVSKKQPVHKANRLAELIRDATERSEALDGRPLAMLDNYLAARVLSAYLLSEPVEVPGDESGYARVTFDLQIDWARA